VKRFTGFRFVCDNVYVDRVKRSARLTILQRCSCRDSRIPAKAVTVSVECGGSADLLGEEVRPNNATTPRTALAACPGTYAVPAMYAGLPLSGTAPQYLADTLSLSTNVAARCRLRSADSRTLQLPSTRRTTLGDGAFSVAAEI